ncbi:MAG: sugar kinase [Candidatus Marinimicrobia bacterium]|nr:sugar kinase [Candidatus Neomarinimicrobiota bacterium]|tara:strand:- start:7176 stop:8144 length:969 start_codon:yes stop_codon:yes gene_type:complete
MTTIIFFRKNIVLLIDLHEAKMSINFMEKKLISAVGSIALDWLELPNGLNGDTLGGSLSYFTRSAGVLAPVSVIGVIGSDFPIEGVALFKKYANNIDDLQVKNGNSFRWGGKYHANWEDRTTLYTDLGVFATFRPKMSETNRKSSLVYLGNIHPSLQLDVIKQISSDNTIIVCDTMNLWINTTRNDLDKVLKKIDVLLVNESEAQLLTGREKIEDSAEIIQRMGPINVIIKQGAEGATLFSKDKFFYVPSYTIEGIIDPTGAGDTFGGGLMAALSNDLLLEEGIIWGNAAASFCVEGFGLEGLKNMTEDSFENRVKKLKSNF